MNKKHYGKTKLETMLVMLMLIIFSICAYTLVVATASSYEKNQNEMIAKDSLRLATSYIDSKIKQSDSKKIEIVDIDISDKKAISIQDDVEGVTYQNIIYYKDGYLKELYVEKGTNLSEVEGFDIANIKDISIENKANGLVEISITTADKDSKEYKSKTLIKLK